MNKAIVIGVSRYKSELRDLDSINGAKSFAKWIQTQGYDVEVITDSENNPVTTDRIFQEVNSIVKKRNTQRLIIYFTGHGILNGMSELWLLSDAHINPSASINVTSNAVLARLCGIPNVIFISDACRSRSPSRQYDYTEGGYIFPRPGDTLKPGHVDQWFATLPGNPALELNMEESAAVFSSAYTEVFVSTHISGPKSVTDERMVKGEKVVVVDTRKLRDHLSIALPQMLLERNVNKTQIPDAIIQSDPDFFFSKYQGNASFSEGPASRESIVSVGESVRTASYDAINGGAPEFSTIRIPQENKAAMFDHLVDILSTASDLGSKSDFKILDTVLAGRSKADIPNYKFMKSGSSPDNLRDALLAAFSLHGRNSFETRTGLSVFGVEVANVFGFHTEVLATNDARTDIRAFPEENNRTLLLKFKDGTGALIPCLAGYIGTLTVGDHGVSNLIYQSVDFEPTDELVHLRATIAAANNMGVFNVDRVSAKILAERILKSENIDPTLALYATYAYHRMGLSDLVNSIKNYMVELKLFDLELLDRSPLDTKVSVSVEWKQSAPICPLFSQGWNLLNIKNVELAPVVRQAGRHRTASLWTTFDQEGTRILIKAYEKGELL